MVRIKRKEVAIVILVIICFIIAFVIKLCNEDSIHKKSDQQKPAQELVIVPENDFWESKRLDDIKISDKVKQIQEEKGTSTAEAIAIVTYKDDDYIDLLSRLVYSESGILGDEAQILTASVVMNRIKNPHFPDNMYGVIYDIGQYAVVDNGTINNPPSEQARKNAEFVYYNGAQCPDDVVYQAEFIQGSGLYKEVEGMYFCYE